MMVWEYICLREREVWHVMLELGYMMGRWSTDTEMNISALTAPVHACRSIEFYRNTVAF